MSMEDDDIKFEIGTTKEEDLIIGEIYPLFGIITDIYEQDGRIIVQINNNMHIEMKEGFGEGKTLAHGNVEDKLSCKPKTEILKDYLLEKGIFISKLVQIEPEIKFVCQVVLLGKKELLSNH